MSADPLNFLLLLIEILVSYGMALLLHSKQLTPS